MAVLLGMGFGFLGGRLLVHRVIDPKLEEDFLVMGPFYPGVLFRHARNP